ncbi:MAG: bifunctional adenosylcobinamide kinase/adenosylcobinamide-phosphate guanylyltransferase [Actinomycetota bacterium]
MPLVFLTGGARAGKSKLAVELAASRSREVDFIATAEALDDEMAERIARHRAERPGHWRTLEEPVEIASALELLPEQACAVIDCLTLWVSNLMDRDFDDDDIEQRASALLSIARARTGLTVVVSNEVGAGIVPVHPEARRFRDLLGRANCLFAEAADRSLLVVAGRALSLADPRSILGTADG